MDVERSGMFQQAELEHILHTIPWFIELSENQIENLASIVNIRHIHQGDFIFREGDSEGNIYILLDGEVNIDIQIPGREKVCIFKAEPLDIIGWSSLTPMVRQRTASALAVQDSNCLEFNSEALTVFCEEDPKLGYIIMKRISNLVASRLLTTRIQLMDQILKSEPS
jgi:CRP-like cAMP-binding protein